MRFTQDADLLIRRGDLDAAKQALETDDFHHRHAASIDMFLDGPEAMARDAIRAIFAGAREFASFRDKHRTHLRGMLEGGLIDESWLTKLAEELTVRLLSLIDTPEG